MIKALEHRRSGMLKSYFVQHILLTFLKYAFFLYKMDICSQKVITSKLHPPPTSVCFRRQINIMHEYTVTKSKYPGKIGDT